MPATATPSAPVSPTTEPTPPAAGADHSPSLPPTGAEPKGPPAASKEEAFAQLDEIDKAISETRQKSPPPPGAKRPPAEVAKDPEKAVEKAKEAEKPAEKPAEKKPAQQPEEDFTKVKHPELVAAHKNLKKEHREIREQFNAAKQRLEELEAKAAEYSQLPQWQEKLSAAEKRAQELEEAIRFADYEKSPEYKQKYFQPVVDAYQNARTKIASLKIVEQKDPETDDVIRPARQATEADFDAIMRIQDDGDAADAAQAMFGNRASLVMWHREKINDLNGARTKAIEEFRAQGSEREQQFLQQTQAQQEKVRGVFQKSVQEGVEKYPQWFKADEADTQGAEMLQKGMANADSVFSGSNLPPEQQAKMHAAFRNMAGAFPYVALKLSRAEAKIKELEGELEAFKSSEPTEPGRERAEATGPMSADAEIDELEKAFKGRR